MLLIMVRLLAGVLNQETWRDPRWRTGTSLPGAGKTAVLI
jgi:hypothetical protein